MCSERNGAEKCDPLEFENDWDIALQQLKYDIDLTEKQILLSEHARLMDNRNFTVNTFDDWISFLHMPHLHKHYTSPKYYIKNSALSPKEPLRL
ncbi:hypothetical protein RUM43_002741 [Polyplax serrata]|uniref:Uncharacterized protein n=1 Tax=Polyplax serrata TaxID=468196 RepID=A0AAN8NZ72_POLSC